VKHDPRPLIAHVVFRFDVGGLENGVVNLLNALPFDRFRHAVIALTEITTFRRRVLRDDVEFIALQKPPGHALRLYPRLIQMFRRMKPDIVHTRNLAALEVAVPAWLAGVPVRIHGEHGRDIGDLDGSNRRYRRIRRLYHPFVSRYVTVSKDLERYMQEVVGGARVTQIYNGVDTTLFAPAANGRAPIADSPFNDPGLWVVGTVGRLMRVKDQVTLAKAFARLVHMHPGGERIRLIVAGTGPLREAIERVLVEANLQDRAWLCGERNDVADVMRGLDCFVLPSLAEGISNTILEAMATRLPIVATRVGGNSELIDDGTNGTIIAADSPDEMAAAVLRYRIDPALAGRHAQAARDVALECFSLVRMAGDYRSLYESVLRAHHSHGHAPMESPTS
jgi:sugar transferase (PEP-CTERM/EpsH1 system associated)